MKFTKVIEYQDGYILVYFVDQHGYKQGTLSAYASKDASLLREEELVYVKEFKDDIELENSFR